MDQNEINKKNELSTTEPNSNNNQTNGLKRSLSKLSDSDANVTDKEIIECLEDFEKRKKNRTNSIEIIDSIVGINSEEFPIILNGKSPIIITDPITIDSSFSQISKNTNEEDEASENEDSNDSTDTRDYFSEPYCTNNNRDYSDDEPEYDEPVSFYNHFLFQMFDCNQCSCYDCLNDDYDYSLDRGYNKRVQNKNSKIVTTESDDEVLLELSLFEIKKKNGTTKILQEKSSNPDLNEIEDNGSYDLSLICPISKTRLENPGRGDDCKHIECFNLKVYLKMNQKLSNRSNVGWNCPICSKKTVLAKLYKDQFIIDLLTNFEDSSLIQLKKIDNIWKPLEKDSNKNIDLVELV